MGIRGIVDITKAHRVRGGHVSCQFCCDSSLAYQCMLIVIRLTNICGVLVMYQAPCPQDVYCPTEKTDPYTGNNHKL